MGLCNRVTTDASGSKENIKYYKLLINPQESAETVSYINWKQELSIKIISWARTCFILLKKEKSHPFAWKQECRKREEFTWILEGSLENHKIFEVQRCCWTSATPTPLLKPRSATAHSSCWVLGKSENGDSTNSLGNMCQCFVTLTVAESLLMFRENLLCFRFARCLWPRWAQLSSLHTPFKYFHTLMRSSWAFSSSTVPSLAAFTYMRDAPKPWSFLWPFLDLTAFKWLSFFQGCTHR